MLNKALHLIRTYHQLNQHEASVLIGLSQTMICEVEKGNKQPSLDTLVLYARAFHMRPFAILLLAEALSEGGIDSNEHEEEMERISNMMHCYKHIINVKEKK